MPFLQTDVTSWASQVALFKAAHAHYGRIDHVFANAGIKPTETFLEDEVEVDERGEEVLREPGLGTVGVNLRGVVFTVRLGVFYLKKNMSGGNGDGGEGKGRGRGGSIVITASASSFLRFPTGDYSTSSFLSLSSLPSFLYRVLALSFKVGCITHTYNTQALSKHAVLGLMRALHPQLHPHLPIRINAIAPSWTDTGIVPRELLAALGEGNFQSADVVARSVTLLMADEARHGELIYSDRGNYIELENGEKGFHAMTKRMLGVGEEEEVFELEVMRRIAEAREAAVAASAKEV